MHAALESLTSNPDMNVGIRNFFQLEASVNRDNQSLGIFKLLKGDKLLTTKQSFDGLFSYNLEDYGNYRITYESAQDKSNGIEVSTNFRFDGFGADPNIKTSPKIAILGISRLALIVSDLLKLADVNNITFITKNSNHIGKFFAGSEILSFDSINIQDYDQWILMNGVTPDIEKEIKRSNRRYGYLASTNTAPIETYLNNLPVMQLHKMAHDYYNANIQIGADFITRYLRRRFGSVLPASVDLSGARFAYGCISSVINKNASIGQGVTIGQNVTIGGRNGTHPVIEDNVWIGAGAVILGCKIGKNAIIAANAVVIKDVPPGATMVTARIRELN